MFRRLAPLIACLAFVPGCSPVDTGDATVRWGVGLTGSCSGASLERVRVELATTDGIVVERQDEYCQTGITHFYEIPVGTYRAYLTGFDETGVAAYEGTVTDIYVDSVAETGPNVGRLAPRPGEIGFAWYFQSGRLCSAYDVGTVRLRLYADDTEVVRMDASCDRGEMLVDDLRATSYDVRLDAIDRYGDISHSYTLAGLKLRPGHHVDLEAALAPCAGQCL